MSQMSTHPPTYLPTYIFIYLLAYIKDCCPTIHYVQKLLIHKHMQEMGNCFG
jgi:hypothetical protein